MMLNKKYALGVHVMWYEILLLPDMVQSVLNMMETIDNPENVYFDICFNQQENIETLDTELKTQDELEKDFLIQIEKLESVFKHNLNYTIKKQHDPFYMHTDYRREFNRNYCRIVDYLIWKETDSLIPKEALMALESLSQYTDSIGEYKYLACFADRKMWDDSWNPTVHPDYEHLKFEDGPDSHLNPNQAKSQMSIEKMNEINSTINEFQISYIPYPKIDGSCLIMTSDLIKSGVNVPNCFLYNDDEGMGILIEKLMKGKFKQYIFKNLLKVHARRHPNKRMYVKGEDNEHSFVDKKNNKFQELLRISKHNIHTLRTEQGKLKEI